MNWFYYDNDEKKGAVNDAQLKSLATTGIIKRETIIETEDGRVTTVQNIRGLFSEPPTQKFNPFIPPEEKRTKNRLLTI